MENYKKNAIQLLSNLALSEKKLPAVVSLRAAKTSVSKKEIKYFPRRIGGYGYHMAKRLSEMLGELEADYKANVHSIMVIKGAEVILEASIPGYDVNLYHLAHSMSKTVTGLAIGFLFDEKKLNLDEKIINIFPFIPFKDEAFSNVTVRHLISMRSGVPFAELGSVTEDEWTKAFFESKLSFAPGEKFSYNSMNSYILARIVEKKSGMNFIEYINEKLFSKLYIDNFLWETGPEGTEKGGFGLYLSAESFAKIGFMILRRGMFEGQRILSEEFIDIMTEPVSNAPDSTGYFDYGLHIWVSPDGKEYLMNGMLGQNVWICPENDIVVSLLSGNNELFSDSSALSIIRKYLLVNEESKYGTRSEYKELKRISENFFGSRRAVSPLVEKRGLPYLLKLKNPKPYDESWNEIFGEYAARDNNAGILPLFVRVMQNNYQGGFERISISRSGDKIALSVTEGGKVYNYTVGLYEFTESVIDFGGEKYIVKCLGERAKDEYGNTAYKIEFLFPELPNTRILEITHAPDGINLKLKEMPNQNIAETYFSSITANSKFSFALNLIEKKMGDGFINKRLEYIFNPTLDLINTSFKGYEDILASDNLKLNEEREKSTKLLRTLISKFTGEPTEEQVRGEQSGIQGFFAKALSLLFKKAAIDSAPADESSKAERGIIIDIPDDIITFLDNNDAK